MPDVSTEETAASSAQPRTAWLQASARIVDAVLNGAEVREVLDQITLVAREVAAADLALLALVDDDGSATVEFADGEGSADYVGLGLDHSGHLPDSHGGGLTHVHAIAADGQTLGLLVLVRFDPAEEFDPTVVDTISNIADQAAIGLQMSRMGREREKIAVLEDRDRIARDLHDLVLQRLFASGLTLQGMLRDPAITESMRERLTRVIDDLDATVVEVRQAVFLLRESQTGRPTGLRGKVLRECAAASRWLGFQPTVGFRGEVDSAVPDAVAEQLLAVLREALANVARHANATWTQVSVQIDGHDVVLQVTDDGQGMGETDRRSGLGNMARRAEELGGSSTIEPTYSATGKGTRLTWRVPVR